jgi:hypothetical protein
MLHTAYIPKREQIIEVIGIVRYDDGIHFIFWDQMFGKYDGIPSWDCVPYDGEILPRKVIEPTWMLPQKGSVPTLKSLVEPGEEYDEICDDCPGRFACFPSKFQGTAVTPEQDERGETRKRYAENVKQQIEEIIPVTITQLDIDKATGQVAGGEFNIKDPGAFWGWLVRNRFIDRVKNEEAIDPKGDGQVDGGPTGGFDGQ